MKIKEVSAKVILNSRGEKTIEILINQNKETKSSAPSGKSKGKYEKRSWIRSVEQDIRNLKKIDFSDLDIENFYDLSKIEKRINKKIGANTRFALESSVLRAVAFEKNKEVWQLLNPKAKRFPKVLSNTIGGGRHSKVKEGKRKPDIQEFLFFSGRKPSAAWKINKKAHAMIGQVLNKKEGKIGKNDENAWKTKLDNEEVLEIMKEIGKKLSLEIGVDVAASEIYKNGRYYYKNKEKKRGREEQKKYILELVKKYGVGYIEDPFEENDFKSFSEINKKLKNKMIIGDDLTVTNLIRVKKALKEKSVSGVIIKPNQIGSLVEVKEIIELCRKKNIRTIISHRSGETSDNIISDLGFGGGCDFIKTPVVGKERESKVRRLIQIEKSVR